MTVSSSSSLRTSPLAKPLEKQPNGLDTWTDLKITQEWNTQLPVPHMGFKWGFLLEGRQLLCSVCMCERDDYSGLARTILLLSSGSRLGTSIDREREV